MKGQISLPQQNKLNLSVLYNTTANRTASFLKIAVVLLLFASFFSACKNEKTCVCEKFSRDNDGNIWPWMTVPGNPDTVATKGECYELQGKDRNVYTICGEL